MAKSSGSNRAARSPSLAFRARRLWFALLPLALVLFGLEVAALCYYFQERGPEAFALQAAWRDLRAARSRASAAGRVAELELPPAPEIYAALYGEVGAPLLRSFETRYAGSFAELASLAAEAESRLLVLYVPSPFEDEVARRVDDHARTFYRGLADAHGADFYDASSDLAAYPPDQVYLLPRNSHLSRLGNQLLADAVAGVLTAPPFRGHRSQARWADRPTRLGDLPPSSRRVWENEELPFLVTTNAQGLRMGHDLVFPKTRPRILLLGDSFTFGINLPDAHTYPQLLQERARSLEIVNAGVMGYTILDETALFRERARFVEPDVTVLQVLFNDLYGLFYFERNLFARSRRGDTFYFGRRQVGGPPPEPPSPAEVELLSGLGMAF